MLPSDPLESQLAPEFGPPPKSLSRSIEAGPAVATGKEDSIASTSATQPPQLSSYTDPSWDKGFKDH